MIAEILNIGTELLTGKTLNTHQKYLGSLLNTLGFDVCRIIAIPDHPITLSDELKSSAVRANLIVTTGGLGPTHDDITLQSAIKTFNLPTYESARIRSSIQKYLALSNKKPTRNQYRQSIIPKNSIVLPNNRGTAPGLMVRLIKDELKSCALLLLPGPPTELIPMCSQYLQPAIKKFFPHLDEKPLSSKTFYFPGSTESQISTKVDSLLKSKINNYGIYASPGLVKLILFKKGTLEETKSFFSLQAKRIKKNFKDQPLSISPETPFDLVKRMMVSKNQTLSLAESCTGGLLSHQITSQPGASTFFVGGMTTYHNKSKIKLGIPNSTINKHGAVSKRVALAMADKCRIFFQSDWALSITGIAGPSGGTPKKPTGTVWIALAGPNISFAWHHSFSGERSVVQLKACWHATSHLLRMLSSKI